MNTATELPDDPLGYRLDLQDSLESPTPAAPNPVPAALALARCTVSGVTLPDDLRQRAMLLLSAAVPTLRGELSEWAESARTLGVRWTDADDPWEADELVRTLIELRTDALGLERVVGEPLSAAVREFDAALKDEEGLLATVVGSNWFANLRQSLATELLAEAWWLYPVAEPVEDLPPPEYFAVVRRVRRAKSAFPALVETPALAADVADTAAAPLPTTLRWKSPDDRYEARLNLPAVSSQADETVPRPLKLIAAGAAVAGLLVRLGGVSQTSDTNGRIPLTLAELRPNWDGRLFVGTPEVEWPLAVDDEE